MTEGKTVSEVARNLGLTRSLLQRWIEQHRAQDPDGNPGKTAAPESEETRRLRKQRRDVTEERDILKKALLGSTSQRNTLVQEHRETFRVGMMCRVWKVSRSGCYAWR